MFGWSASEIVGKPVATIVTPELDSALDQFLERYREIGEAAAQRREVETTGIYTLSLHDALPISCLAGARVRSSESRSRPSSLPSWTVRSISSSSATARSGKPRLNAARWRPPGSTLFPYTTLFRSHVWLERE